MTLWRARGHPTGAFSGDFDTVEGAENPYGSVFGGI